MELNPLRRYTDAAGRSAGVVISAYSTSFGLACRLLGPEGRRDIANIYALVRVADEAVDGAAAAAGLDAAAVREQLDRLERETETAMLSGYSTNMVVHAFAETARRRGIGTDLTRPFFASMRADITVAAHTDDSLEEYIYGSAEVVGLMCLRVFQSMPGAVSGHDEELAVAARRLGAAFQKVNFLRDLAADNVELGRSYFPRAEAGSFDEALKLKLVAEIREDLDAARKGIALLPPGACSAVELAHGLFSALVNRLERVPADELLSRRVRVGSPQKAAIALRVLARQRLRGRSAA
ncbi:phytoene/squalene synthase family protein [Arthrobacter sp. CAU 1506]|uniref:phytoene/squalene synthase family protein n=1 Tax=Arthrobacter sp. CAU 1506 TaxID=2560052 RepID=UPI0010AD1078|nr:squalene/phytoene synthase family protein [Arthrobacter sp. CAU 1506]TJY72591.1 phytoene/squalene synthase family protein [Arthrobacter sp. CAU 1506]